MNKGDQEHIDSYYSRNADHGLTFSPLQEHLDTDVCVIGGGLAGLAVALGLLERGKKVAILESNRLGWGASGRNGGFVLAGYAASEKQIIKKVGKAQTREMFALTRDAQKLIKQRAADYNIDCDIQNGFLKASWHKDGSYIKEAAVFYNEEYNVPAEFWTRDKVQSVCKTQRYYDGMLIPDYFHMNPLKYIQGLAKTITDKGGRIFERTTATKIRDTTSKKSVFSPAGQINANHVVYCGSAYFNGLNKTIQRSCLPISTYVMNTHPVDPDKLKTAITKNYAIRDTRWTDDYYRILPDNSILWGGRVGLGKTVPANLDHAMMQDLLKIYPQLEGIKSRVSWAGTMGYTVHKMPHIGKLKPGHWYCTNFGGNGVGPTTAGGEIIASAIANNDETYKLFEPYGFRWTGGILGPYVAQAVYYGWNLRDKIQDISIGKKA